MTDTTKQDLEHIDRRYKEQLAADPLCCVHWMMFFRRPDGRMLVYDAKHPTSGYVGIKRAHPDYTYITIRGCDTVDMAVSHAKASRQAAKGLDWLDSQTDIAI